MTVTSEAFARDPKKYLETIRTEPVVIVAPSGKVIMTMGPVIDLD